jgi:hypothetical protein
MNSISKYKEIHIIYSNKNKKDIVKEKISIKIVNFIIILVKISQEDLCNYLLSVNF